MVEIAEKFEMPPDWGAKYRLFRAANAFRLMKEAIYLDKVAFSGSVVRVGIFVKTRHQSQLADILCFLREGCSFG